MKATPIAKYLNQKARQAEPVAWPLLRQKARPAMIAHEAATLAAPLFRRATLLEAESRGRESSDRPPNSQADSDARRRESIFSRARAAAFTRAAEPEPEPAPEPDIETRLAEAYHRGVQEGLDAAKGETANARLLERAEAQKRSVVERLDFQMNEYAQSAEKISSGLLEIEHRIADVVAGIIQPFVTEAVSRKILDELIENIARLRQGGQPGLMRIRGPERVLNLLKDRLSRVAVDVEYVSEDAVEVTVEAQHTNIRSEFASWMNLLASLGEQG
jgi:hypothetical protein